MKLLKRLKRKEEWVMEEHHLMIITFIIAISILSVLLNGEGIFLYASIVLILLSFSHFLNKHKHKAHDTSIIIGLFIVPATITIVFFNDLFSWTLLLIYLTAFFSAIGVYHYHNKKHKLLHTMWKVIFSRLVSVTFAVLTFIIISNFLPSKFISLPTALIYYIAPTIFVYFLITKFLYLLFFDPKHPRKDFFLSARHSLAFTIVFMLIVIFSYAVVATLLFNNQDALYKSQLEKDIVDMNAIGDSIQFSDAAALKVTRDIESFRLNLQDRIERARSAADNQDVQFPSIMNDQYISTITSNAINLIEFHILEEQLILAKDDIVRKQATINNLLENNIPFEDGSKTLEQRITFLKTKSFIPQVRERDEILDELAQTDQYDYYEENGFNWLFGDREGLTRITAPNNFLELRAYEVLKHTIAFKEFARFSLENIIFVNSEVASPSIANHLNTNLEESQISKTIRLEMIHSE